MRLVQFLAMLGAVLAFAACGGGGPATTTGPVGSPAGATAATAVACTGSGGQAVSIQNFAFNPASVTVAAGGTVTWTNNDSTAHTVTFDSGPNCQQLSGSETKTATFSVAGSYPYHCSIHPTMKGTVVVQ
jgi:plastocyanin